MKPSGTDEKPAQELSATPDAATVQYKNLIAPLPVPTPDNYYVPILVKFYILPVLITANSTYYVVL